MKKALGVIIIVILFFVQPVFALNKDDHKGWWKDDFIDTSGISSSTNFNTNPGFDQEIIAKQNGIHDFIVDDIDGDGNLDIAGDGYTGNFVKWFKNNPGSLWSVYSVDTAILNAHDIQLGDIDNDGKKDLVAVGLSGDAANYQTPPGTLQWYKKPSDPTGAWTKTIIDSRNDGTLIGARQVALDDIDNDGNLDIVVVTDNESAPVAGGNVIWYKNPGGSDALVPANWHRYDIDPLNLRDHQYVTIGDLDGDGRKDLIVTGSFLTAYFAPSDPTIPGDWNRVVIDNLYWSGNWLYDMDNDGDLDILSGGMYTNHKFSWWENPGGSSSRTALNWTQHLIEQDNINFVDKIKGIRLADLDLDGDNDIVIAGYVSAANASFLKWYERGASATDWTAHTLLDINNTTINGIHEVVVGDFNGDGLVDIVIPAAYSNEVVLFKNHLKGIRTIDSRWKASEQVVRTSTNTSVASQVTYRNIIKSANIPESSDKIKICFRSSTENGGINVSAKIGEANPADFRDIIGSYTDITFQGSTSTGLLAKDTTICSDEMNFSIDSSKNYTVTWVSSTAVSHARRHAGTTTNSYYRPNGNFLNDQNWSDNTPAASNNMYLLDEIFLLKSSEVKSILIFPDPDSVAKWSWGRFYNSSFGNFSFDVFDESDNVIAADIANGEDLSSITNQKIKLRTTVNAGNQGSILYWGTVLGGIYEGSITNTVASGGSYNYSIPPFGFVHVDMQVIPSHGNINIEIDTWQRDGQFEKKWTEDGSSQNIVTTHIVGDLAPNKYYSVEVDNKLGTGISGSDCADGICMSDSQGKVNFVYTGGYPDHTFSITEYRPIELPDTGFDFYQNYKKLISILILGGIICLLILTVYLNYRVRTRKNVL